MGNFKASTTVTSRKAPPWRLHGNRCGQRYRRQRQRRHHCLSTSRKDDGSEGIITVDLSGATTAAGKKDAINTQLGANPTTLGSLDGRDQRQGWYSSSAGQASSG